MWFQEYRNAVEVALLTLFFPLLVVVAVLAVLLSLLQAQVQLLGPDFLLLPD